MNKVGAGIAIGVVVGVGIGLAIGNIGVGASRQKKDDEE